MHDQHETVDAERADEKLEALFDNRWSGKKHAVLATSWSAVGRRDMVQWAEDQRDSRCSAHPLSRRAAGAPLNFSEYGVVEWVGVGP